MEFGASKRLSPIDLHDLVFTKNNINSVIITYLERPRKIIRDRILKFLFKTFTDPNQLLSKLKLFLMKNKNFKKMRTDKFPQELDSDVNMDIFFHLIFIIPNSKLQPCVKNTDLKSVDMKNVEIREQDILMNLIYNMFLSKNISLVSRGAVHSFCIKDDRYLDQYVEVMVGDESLSERERVRENIANARSSSE